VRRLDSCLLPAVVILFLMNILDRFVIIPWNLYKITDFRLQKQYCQCQNCRTTRYLRDIKHAVQHMLDDFLCRM
jgi:hypothetical protein